MLNTIYATKIGMTQVWSKDNRRLPVTRLKVEDNLILNQFRSQSKELDQHRQGSFLILELAYGQKKLKNMTKPLKGKIKKGGFSQGFRQLRGVRVAESEEAIKQYQAGQTVKVADVLKVGDLVKVQGKSKGRGFTGVVKRHGFKGGPRTHGQSDRLRAPGAIGSGTDPGRIWKGLRMGGRSGGETKVVKNLVVVYIDEGKKEVWVNGPVPGSVSSYLKIEKLNKEKKIELNLEASGLVAEKPAEESKIAPEAEVKPAAPEAKKNEAKPAVPEAKKNEVKPAVQETKNVEAKPTTPETKKAEPKSTTAVKEQVKKTSKKESTKKK